VIGIKEIQLLKEISLNKKNLDDLANIMELSERSVRYKIKNLNEYFKDEQLQIKINLKNKIVELIGDLKLLEKKQDFSKFNSYIYSQEERIEILINLLLFNKKKFQVEEYQDLVDISESTFKKDWKLLREKFEKLNIKIINRKYFTILEANEEKIRTNMLKNIIKYRNSNLSILTNKIIIKIIEEYFSDINFDELDILLKKISKDLQIIPSDDAFDIIKYTLAMALERGKNSPLKKEGIKNIQFLKNTEEYNIIKKILEEFLKKYEIKEFEAEILNLTEYFLGSHSYNIKYSFYENWIHIETMVYKLIKKVADDIGVDFIKDTELFEGILNHIKPMIYRIRKGIKLENSIAKEIREESPEIFYILQKNISILEKFIKCKVDEDELAYLCVFFKLAIKKYEFYKIPRVMIVCNFGYGISKILEARLKEKFNIVIVKTIPLYELNDNLIKKEKIDLVISTTQLKNIKISTPLISINPLLETQDIENLKNIGIKELQIDDYYKNIMGIIKENCIIKNEDKLQEELNLIFNKKFIKKFEDKTLKILFSDFISEKNIRVVKKVKSFEEAIELSGNILLEKGSIKKEYIDSCLKAFKEQGLYMIIGANTILPHSDNFKNVMRTDYSFLKLIEPLEIIQEEEKLKIENIILLASSDGKEHRESLLDLKFLIDKKKIENTIRECKNKKEILKKIKNESVNLK
jgi:transcriptional antiterminator/mannitol/fructose-specific phosphotransferase system IIA component (Ntr-type)